MMPKQQTISKVIRSIKRFDCIYKIESPAKEPNFPASILPNIQPTNSGIPTERPATIGKCHCLFDLFKVKNDFNIV